MKLFSPKTLLIAAVVLIPVAHAEPPPASTKADTIVREREIQIDSQGEETPTVTTSGSKTLRGGGKPIDDTTVEFKSVRDEHEDAPEEAIRKPRPKMVTTFDKRLHEWGGSDRAAAPSVVFASEVKPGVVKELKEDLAVMSRILNKATDGQAQRDEHNWAMGIAVSTLGVVRRPESLYLEGHGAVFFLQTQFPLAERAPKKEKELQAGEERSDWDEARQELFGDPLAGSFQHVQPGGARGKVLRFDSERVEGLKKSLIESLKNVRNIRGMKPEDWVTVVVSGPAVMAGSPGKVRIIKTAGTKPSNIFIDTGGEAFGVEGVGADASGTQLTLRVRKSDAEAFAKGALSLDEFQKKTTVATY